MARHSGFDQLLVTEPVALTIGVFDGVHCGHQFLIGRTVEQAHRIGGVSAVLTFDPHPDRVLRPDRQRLYLCNLEQRLELIDLLGVDHVVVLKFDPAFSQQTAEAFIDQLCGHFSVRELWVGHDFRLGYRGLGTVEVLANLGKDRGFTVHPIQAEVIGGIPISSTWIRQRLGEGDLQGAARGLGRPFTVRGQVVEGAQRGRTIGFPTANVQTPPDQLLPADGVYACRVQLATGGDLWPAVTNIGVRPTFGVLARTVEAHLLRWQGDLYGQIVEVQFVERLRGEQRFAGIEGLVSQIRQDAEQAASILGFHS